MMKSARMAAMLFLAVSVLNPLALTRAAQAGDDTLYRQQMNVYQKLNEEYRQRQEALRQLQQDVERREARRQQLAPKLKKMSEKIAGYQAEQADNDRKIADSEQQIKESEMEAVNKNLDYWRSQSGFDNYQGDYRRLSSEQEKARTRIKKCLLRADALAAKLNSVKESMSVLSMEDKALAAQIIDLRKQIDSVSAPLTKTQGKLDW